MKTKICSNLNCPKAGCHQPLTAFYANTCNKKDGRRSNCKLCVAIYEKQHPWKARERNWKYSFHIVNADGSDFKEHDFKVKLAQQGGHCHLCLETKGLLPDHDHGTGIVRSLLCKKHNTHVGFYEVMDVQAIQVYIASYKTTSQK